MKKRIKYSFALMLCFVIFICSSLFACASVAAPHSTITYIEIRNELTGSVKSDENEEFVFKLLPIDNAPMPQNDTAIVNGSATVSFGAITYTKPGVYSYNVRLEQGNNENITYDKTVYLVYVTVVNIGALPDNGLVASVAAIKNLETGEKTNNGILFSSTCHYNDEDGPHTNDPINMMLWISLIVISVIILIVVFVSEIVSMRRKRKSRKVSN